MCAVSQFIEKMGMTAHCFPQSSQLTSNLFIFLFLPGIKLCEVEKWGSEKAEEKGNQRQKIFFWIVYKEPEERLKICFWCHCCSGALERRDHGEKQRDREASGISPPWKMKKWNTLGWTLLNFNIDRVFVYKMCTVHSHGPINFWEQMVKWTVKWLTELHWVWRGLVECH